MRKIKYLIIIILLLPLTVLYIHNQKAIPTRTNDLSISDRTIFEGGYHYLSSEKFDVALEYYRSIKNKLQDEHYITKNHQIVLILTRLNNALKLYTEEKELLRIAETFREKFLDQWYESLLEIYSFYHLSEEVILGEDYDREEELINKYLTRIVSFEALLNNINIIDSQFFNSEDQRIFSKSIEYSIFPTRTFYRTTHLAESISLEDIDKVERAWNYWEEYYNKVMDYYQAFDEGLYFLKEEVIQLREGYNEIRRQLTRLIPNLKFDLVL